MSVLRIYRNTFFIKHVRNNSSTSAGIIPAAEYPPITKNTFHEKKEAIRLNLQNELENVVTVEEKLMKINLPRYYGRKSLILRDNNLIPYNALPFIKYCTRTYFRQQTNLPEYYDKIVIDKNLTEHVCEQIKDALHLQYNVLRSIQENNLSHKECEDKTSKSVVHNVNRIIINTLLKSLPHLRTVQVDVEPRHEAFWFIGGLPPPKLTVEHRKKLTWLKDNYAEPVDRPLQYLGSPCMALRAENSLPPIVSMNMATDLLLDIPKFEYDPRVIGYSDYEQRNGTNIPGFWPGEASEFGLLSFHQRGHLLTRSETYGSEDNQEALHAQGITSSFSWLLSQACYQGFSIYNDITYPFVTQTVITNGQIWSFYVYQLNTILLNATNTISNPKRNFCWGTQEMKLFEGLDNEGNIIGFNSEVVNNLIKFYMNVPKPKLIEMKPYLKHQEKVVADILDEEKRTWLENQYKYMMSNRPRHRLPYEVYHWEKIYKVDHKTRPLEPRRRPFELDQNPYKRTYQDHKAKYVPKKLRPEGTKSKKHNRWEKTYYP